ncbi:MAG: tyrosine-type recombinase/integrase [Clostridium sp.]|nr:tyrosine-type recombinase/integrase [Clostridium sp.]MCM1173094.1 tyrosine-type recombinase/integrase [Clostridium sp.]
MADNYNLPLDNMDLYDIIEDGNNVLDMLMKDVLSKHPYAITPPSSTGGRWQTFYKDENGHRKNIKATSEKLLIKKLMKLYSTDENLDKLTFENLFNEWIVYKESITNSPNTIKRHYQHYNKYLHDSKLNDIPLRKIDDLFLEQICNNLVREYNMSNKEWGNVRTIIKGMYEFAYRKKYITENPMLNVRISVKFRQVAKKTGKSQTFNSDELQALNEYLDKMYQETSDTAFLCVKSNLMLGLRVGELVALKWNDIEENYIHVVREEVRNQVSNEYEVVEHTKTNTDRFVVLPNKVKEILALIPKTSEYIFVRKGEHLHTRQIAYVLEKYAERTGVPVKSTHKMRKTYASMLNANQVPLDCIREMLGHSNLSTTLTYIYNPFTEQETVDIINKAL